MTSTIERLGAMFLVLLFALLANLTYVQVFQAEELRTAPGNARSVLQEYSRERGPILVARAAVARSEATDGELKYLRVYSDGPSYAPATGYYSLVYGSTGIERAENSVLSGRDDRLFADRMQQLFAGQDPQGGGVSLAINAEAQQAAYDGLGDKVGAVAAIDPRTGGIMALASTPSFDPNRLASHNSEDVTEYYQQLTDDPEEPLLNRPLVASMPPGSTFKVVVAAAALESGEYTADSVLPGPATYTLPGTTTELGNWFGEACGPNNEVTLEEALAISCNTAFAWLANELGDDAVRAQAEAFGFGTSFEVPMVAAAGKYPDDPDPSQVAQSGIGQFDVRATALNMAQVTASIANSGTTMAPNLVASITSPDLTVLEESEPEYFADAMSPENAAELTRMMVAVVDRGTGGNASIPGVAVAGKTGTAERGNDEPNLAWFIAFAPAEDPQVAVAVMIENAGTTEVSGNQLAAPIAREVIEAVVSQ